MYYDEVQLTTDNAPENLVLSPEVPYSKLGGDLH